MTSSLDAIITAATIYDKPKNIYYKSLDKHFNQEDIGLVGFSVSFPAQLYHTLILAKLIKAYHPHIFVVIGGSFITKYIEDLINRQEVYKFIDGFIVGDGEEPLAKLIFQLEHSRNLNDVPNFYFRHECGGYAKSHTCFQADANYILEPIFDGFSHYSILPIRISFGCPWGRCTFCTYRLFHRKYSRSDVERIITIVKHLQQKYHISSFQIVDDFLPPVFLRQFSEALLRENIHIQWKIFLGLLEGFNERSILNLMAQSGCVEVNIGIESMSPRILQLMEKPHHPELVKSTIMLLNDTSIKINACIIFGFPTETLEEASETLAFLKKNQKLFSSIGVQPFSLEKDTSVFNNPQEFGITKIYHDDKYGSGVGYRLGYRFDVHRGMSQKESRVFTENAIDELRAWVCLL